MPPVSSYRVPNRDQSHKHVALKIIKHSPALRDDIVAGFLLFGNLLTHHIITTIIIVYVCVYVYIMLFVVLDRWVIRERTIGNYLCYFLFFLMKTCKFIIVNIRLVYRKLRDDIEAVSLLLGNSLTEHIWY